MVTDKQSITTQGKFRTSRRKEKKGKSS